MRYMLLVHAPEPSQDNPIDPELMNQMLQAMGAYGNALESAGVLVAAEVLQPVANSTTVTLRTGSLQVHDGPFAETKEALAGAFVLEVRDLDAALGWAEKCPMATYGVVEVRASATSYVNGGWTRP